MRIWEYVGSAAEAVKRHAPDVSPVKNGCTAAFTKIAEPLKTATFPKMDHIVRISRLCRRETSGAYEIIPGGGAFSVILIKTLIDIVIDLVIEKADPGKQHSVNGSKECIPGVEMDDQWYSSAFQFLKEKVGVYALRECLVFILNEFSVFLRTEAFRSFSRGAITVKYLKPVMKRFVVFVQKRHCGAGFFIIQAIVMEARRKYMCDDQSENEWGFHGSATKGEKKKKKTKKNK